MTRTYTALVTGGSRGIGAAVVGSLRAGGWEVLAPARGELDLSVPASIASFLDRLDEHVDGLVLGAGINDPAPIGKLTMTDWEFVNAVNCTSGFMLVSALCPAMAAAHFGRVVGISSTYATRARAGRAAYSASKASLEGLIRTVAVEFARFGVIANCVAPGFVDTEMTRMNNTPQMIDTLLQRVPVGRLAAPEEIARAVAFLMAPENQYTTGQTLVVDGGFACT